MDVERSKAVLLENKKLLRRMRVTPTLFGFNLNIRIRSYELVLKWAKDLVFVYMTTLITESTTSQ